MQFNPAMLWFAKSNLSGVAFAGGFRTAIGSQMLQQQVDRFGRIGSAGRGGKLVCRLRT